jgi:hypothetical protein
MQVVEVKNQCGAVDEIASLKHQTIVFDFDFTISCFDSTAAAEFWVYDVLKPRNENARIMRQPWKSVRRIAATFVKIKSEKEILTQKVKNLSRGEIHCLALFLRNLPLEQKMVDAVNKLSGDNRVCIISSTPQIILDLTLKSRIPDSIPLIGSFENGRPDICGRKHECVPFEIKNTTIVTDNKEDLDCLLWAKVVFIKYK